MAKLVITENAQQDIETIANNIAEFTTFPASGIKFIEAIYHHLELIAFMPYGMGRVRPEGTRESFMKGYRIVYELFDDEVHITTIIHSRRLYPQH